MCLSKGITGGFLAMGVTLCTEKVAAAFQSENRAHTFYHGHSYTGNALACAAANANLQVFADEPVFQRIANIASINAGRLLQFRNMRPKLYNFFLDRGVLLRPLGNVVYVLPPYIISPEELNNVYDVIQEAIETLF